MTRDTILSAIRQKTQAMDDVPLPDTTRYPLPATRAKAAAFAEAVKAVGGECIDLPNYQPPAIDHQPSTISHRPSTIDHQLSTHFDGHTPTILHAHFGVVENGACWIAHHPEDERTRYTLPEHLAILLPRDALVATMHEAYARIRELGIEDFGIFLSGPSKTADIEQALVIGAQGAITTKVFLV